MFGFGKKKEEEPNCLTCELKEQTSSSDKIFEMKALFQMAEKYQALVGDLRTENTNLRIELEVTKKALKKYTGKEVVQFT